MGVMVMVIARRARNWQSPGPSEGGHACWGELPTQWPLPAASTRSWKVSPVSTGWACSANNRRSRSSSSRNHCTW